MAQPIMNPTAEWARNLAHELIENTYEIHVESMVEDAHEQVMKEMAKDADEPFDLNCYREGFVDALKEHLELAVGSIQDEIESAVDFINHKISDEIKRQEQK